MTQPKFQIVKPEVADQGGVHDCPIEFRSNYVPISKYFHNWLKNTFNYILYKRKYCVQCVRGVACLPKIYQCYFNKILHLKVKN